MLVVFARNIVVFIVMVLRVLLLLTVIRSARRTRPTSSVITIIVHACDVSVILPIILLSKLSQCWYVQISYYYHPRSVHLLLNKLANTALQPLIQMRDRLCGTMLLVCVNNVYNKTTPTLYFTMLVLFLST